MHSGVQTGLTEVRGRVDSITGGTVEKLGVTTGESEGAWNPRDCSCDFLQVLNYLKIQSRNNTEIAFPYPPPSFSHDTLLLQLKPGRIWPFTSRL